MRSQKKLKRWILTFDNLGTVSFEQKWQEWSGLELLITDWRLSQSSLSSVGSTSKCQLLHQSGTFNKKMYKKLWCGWEVKLFELRFVCYTVTADTAAKSLQSCPTLCNPIHGSPSGSPVPRILQERTLEWVAISFSNSWTPMHVVTNTV